MATNVYNVGGYICSILERACLTPQDPNQPSRPSPSNNKKATLKKDGSISKLKNWKLTTR
ncbi:MAG: hypothetical protein R3Y38_08105 [Rikenellaceae bacterium]